MASAVASLSSCLKDNEEEVRYYNDTAVTSFAITTVNKYTHTIAKDGVTDSVYKSSYDAKHHSFYIDQVRKLVYNPDSLPCGVDASKAICAIATKNGGAVVLMMASKTGKDSIVYYNPKDSLDLTRVHKLRVYNTNASAYREYALKVNVHRQTGEELTWSHSGAENLAGVSGRRLVTRRGDVFLFGVKDGKTKVWKGVNGNFQQLDATFSGSAYKNVVAMGDYLYPVSYTHLQTITNFIQKSRNSLTNKKHARDDYVSYHMPFKCAANILTAFARWLIRFLTSSPSSAKLLS